MYMLSILEMINMHAKYVIITPARNEEAYIEKTIQSIVLQTVLPLKWIIVSDNSTDRTDKIVNKYKTKYNFIELVKITSLQKRDFASKVNAFNTGYAKIKMLPYDFIGNIDADVSFDPDYFEKILKAFVENKKIGICAGEIYEYHNGTFRPVNSAPWHVSGAIQLFRRKCFEDIGGYIQIERNIDAIAVIMARKEGWKIKKFPELAVRHYRYGGTAKGSALISRFRYGIFEYTCGFHPFYAFVKYIFRLKERPYVISTLFRMSGYCFAFIKRKPYVLPNDVIFFIRDEQLHRLKDIFFKKNLRLIGSIKSKLKKGISCQ